MMVLILDDNLEIGANVRSNLCYLICLRHLIRSEAWSQIGCLSLENTYFASYMRNIFRVEINQLFSCKM